MSPGGCWRMSFTARWSCTATYGGVVPELASRDHVRRLLPLVRQVLASSRHGARGAGRHRLHGRPRADRGAAHRGGAGAQPGLCLGAAGGGRTPPGRASAGAAARARAATLSARGTPRLGRTYPAHRGGRHRTLPRSGRYPGRRRGRSLRQDGQAPGTSLPGRPGAGAPGAERHPRRLPVSAADARSARPRAQFLGPEDCSAAFPSWAGADAETAGGCRTWRRGGHRRHARRQGGAGTRSHRASTCSWSRAA